MKDLLSELITFFSSRMPLAARLVQFVRQAALVPVLLPLVAFLLAKFYLHWNAVALVEQWQRQLPESVEFEYADIDSSFDGLIELHQARLLLAGMSLPLEFSSMTLVLDHWRHSDQQQQGLSQQRLPQTLQLNFKLATDSLARLSRAEQLPTDLAWQLLGCYSTTMAGETLGDPVMASGQFNYRFEPRSEYLNAELKLNADQRFDLALKADLDLGSDQLDSSGLVEAGLGGLQLEFFNLGSQTSLMQACGATGRSGLVEGPYVAKLSKVVKHRLLQQGWRSSDELEFAYQDYLFQPVKLGLALRSRQPQPWQQLLTDSQAWQVYQTRIVLNRYQTQGNALQWQQQASQLAAAPVQQSGPLLQESPLDAVIEAKPVTEMELPPIEQEVDYQPSFKPVPVRQLNRHIGAPLRLTTHNGRRMEGVLDRLEPGRLQLRRDVAQGVAVVPVRLDIISSAQAYF